MPTAMSELNVCGIPPPERHPRIFSTFESLKPGEAFILVNDHNPKPLLYQFQFEYPGGYEWNILEAGPSRYRIEIVRRTGSPMRTVSDYLQTDHRRLDGIMSGIEELVRAGRISDAATRFEEFACGLNFHIEREERVLFPYFEQKTGPAGHEPVTVMKNEHIDIRRCLADIRTAIANKSPDEIIRSIRNLQGALGPHNMKEEHVLYPVSDDRAADTRELDDLVKKMQAL